MVKKMNCGINFLANAIQNTKFGCKCEDVIWCQSKAKYYIYSFQDYLKLKEHSLIFRTFYSNFWHKIFLITQVKFYNWKVFGLEDIMKTCLVMVILIKLTQSNIDNCSTQNCFAYHPYSLIVSTKMLNLYLWSNKNLEIKENLNFKKWMQSECV